MLKSDSKLLAVPRALLSSVRSHLAERELLRFHRLHLSGLIDEAEFEAKKLELKPKILAGL